MVNFVFDRIGGDNNVDINLRSELNNVDKVISIFVNGDIRNIVLTDFKKEKVTFGRDKSNDIVLNSLFISKFHGYFELKDSNLIVVDNDSKNGIIVNEEKVKYKILENNDYIRIDNDSKRLSNGVVILVKFGQNLRKWNRFIFEDEERITIGNNSDCNIVLPYSCMSNEYIEIVKKDKDFLLLPNHNVCLNNKKVLTEMVLIDNDVISVDGMFLIYYKKEILYQFSEKGVRIDARSIFKTVKVKGKEKDISQNVNMTIYPGKFVAFVGGSGAGKSTFMSFLCGINKPTKGNVLINGKDLFQNYDTLKNVIGYVPQDDIVFTNLTLIDMLTYSADLRMPSNSTPVEKERRINEVLNIVDLVGKENVLIKRLSGGQRKRAGIAVELLADPSLFFLDEPTSGLDPGTERNMMKTLRKMANSGQTVILVTHNTSNIHLCDEVVFFGEGGKVCYDGPPEGAKTFFGVDDFVDIYNLISDDVDNWHTKYTKEIHIEDITIEQIEDNQNKNDENTISNTDKVVNNLFTSFDDNSEYNFMKKIKLEAKKRKENKEKKATFFKQFLTLTKRHFKTIINNKFQLLLLIFQAPIIAFALTLVMNQDLFEYYDMTKSILFSISLAAIYIGLGNSIQEICKEKVILKKEHMANLRLSSYLISKVVVLLLLSVIQAILFVATLNLLIEVPSDGVIFSWNIESTFEIALTIFASSMIGLVVSTVSSDPSVAMTYIPLLLVPQMLFSGMLFELENIIDFLSNFILCRWSLELLGTTNDMNNMISAVQDVIPDYKREAEVFFEFTSSHFYKDVFIILFMSIVLIIICYIILKRQLEVKK